VEANRVLAGVVRDELSQTTHRPGLPAAFAGDLVDGLVARSLEIGRDSTGTLLFLLDDVDYGRDFIVATTRAAVLYELETADDRSLDDPYWPWVKGTTLGAELGGEADPMNVLMENLDDDAGAWRALLTDPTVARYLLAERRLDADGFARLAAGAELAAAGPDVVPDAPAALLHDAALVASAFVNHIASRAELMEAPPEVSVSAARILGCHLFAMHKEVLNPQPLDEPGTLRRGLDAFGPDFAAEVPLLDEETLAAVTDLAVDTDDGLATMRAALNAYEHGFAAAAAEASTRLEHEDPAQFLEQAIGQLGQLEGYLLQHAGHLAEGEGRRRDDSIRRWVDGVVSGIGLAVGKLQVPVPGPLARPAAVKERWATHEAASERRFDEYADEWTESLRYLWFGELHAAGVISPDLPDSVLTTDGQLRPWQELDGIERRIVQDLMEENTWRGSVDVDWLRLSDAIKSAQQDLYADWSE
jgi:hypothetical protein